MEPDVIEMIGDKSNSVVDEYGFMEIMKDEVSRKPETGAPEGIRNPPGKVIEIRRRIVVCDHRRSLIIIITVYILGIRIILRIR